MHSTFLPLKRYLLFGTLFLSLVACSTNQAPTTSPSDITYVATLKLAEGQSQTELEAMYGGQTLVYQPEAGFAILGFNNQESELTTLAKEANVKFSTPMFASGFSAWASGNSAWASGNSAWASGNSAWASGLVGLPGESLAVLDLVGISQAHAIAHNFGQGIKVAVIDTGLDLSHPGFVGRLAPASEWKDYIDGDQVPQDDLDSGGSGHMYGHGTAVAAIIAQVAPQAQILPIRVLDAKGRGDLSNVVLAMDWAISHGAQVINLSLGSNHDLASMKAMIDYASTMGVHVVIATGNHGSNKIDYPAAYANSATVESYIISVGSVDSQKHRSSFSNYDADVEFLVPGENVFSAYPGNQVGLFSGTSFATPIVSGIVALGLGESNPQALESLLAGAAEAMSGTYNGYGIPQADALLNSF